MPSTIPYTPNLALGSVVRREVLQNVDDVATVQAPVQAAKDALQSLLNSKKSLVLTKTELKNLGVETDTLDAELDRLSAEIGRAEAAHAAAKVTAEAQLLQVRGDIPVLPAEFESPLDYLRSGIKTLPIASDSKNMDLQYFPFDPSSQTSAAYSATIASYVSDSLGQMFSPEVSAKMGAAAARQVSEVQSSHDTEGTFVVSVRYNHVNASIVAPFILDVDKAIDCWNHLFAPSELLTNSKDSMIKLAFESNQQDKRRFSMVSGTTFGSSFVGMVHVLKSSENADSEGLAAAAKSLGTVLDASTTMSGYSGTPGLDSKLASDFSNLLGRQATESRVTMLTVGVKPSTIPNEAQIAVEEFKSPDATALRIGSQAGELQSNAIESSMNALTAVEDGENKLLDVSSMTTALDDYLKKAAEGGCGVPVSYYLKDFDERNLAEMWLAKYHPGKVWIKESDIAAAADDASKEPSQEKAHL